MASENNDDDIGGGSNESGEAPLWTYMTKKTKQGAKGRSWSFKCNICGETKSGSYSRVRAHLLGIKNADIAPCKKVTRCEKLNMQRLEDEFEKKKSESGARVVPLPWETSSVASSAFKKRKSSISLLERAFGGLPFYLARNPHYQRSFQFAADNKIDDYVLPGYDKLKTTLLHKERDHVEQLLEPVKLTWKEKGVSIVSDGWSDPTRKPLINFIATSENGPLFLKAVNCFGEVKDKFFISDLMKDVLNEMGHQNVVQIITEYLCSKECGREWITEVHEDALAIKHFIMNQNMRLSIFSKFSPIKLLSVADTRFASIIVMLKRLKLIKRGLQAMIISEEWSTYKEDS
ncbi:unnamed protein product [Arabidopsis thaliana]|uniref:DUF659 domain-containing protein n=1 Tax=Arabidopsis thaliana TaxID=3702 RepID=A0A5S9WXQ2_ARATH|nr:unnamed protein product [Arabidopsis thaliana]